MCLSNGKSSITYFLPALGSLLVMLAMTSAIRAREYYRTMSATVHIKGDWNGTPITAKSDDVFLLLNYETAEFLLQLDKSTLRTGIDSLDRMLANLRYDYIQFEGKLGIDYIRTQKHPPQDFEVEGYLTCAPHNNELINGSGHLEYIFGDVYSCLLSMSFYHLNWKELGFDIDLPGLRDEANVEIKQTVLNRLYN